MDVRFVLRRTYQGLVGRVWYQLLTMVITVGRGGAVRSVWSRVKYFLLRVRVPFVEQV